MNLERFAALVEAYGTDPRRWPAAERQAALSLLSDSVEAQGLVRKVEVLDAMLSRPLASIEPGVQLRNRIMEQVARQRLLPAWRLQITEALALLFPSGRMIPQLAALCLALAVGIGAGITNIVPVDTQYSDLVTLQLSSAMPIYVEE